MLNIKKFNVRLSAVFVSMVVLFVTVFSLSSSKADAGDLTFKYKVFNATTGNYLREYSLTVEGNKTRDIIGGTDDRVIDYTKSGVVKLIVKHKNFNLPYIGSGFVVDDHTIATAAHMVENRQITSILFFDQDGNNCMTITDPVEYHYPSDFVRTGKASYEDYALITVKQSLEDYRCFDFGMMTEEFPDLASNVISVSGFPGEVRGNKEANTVSHHELYTGNGVVVGYETEHTGYVDFIKYTADATGGNSGGPAYVTEHINNQIYYTVIGIHAGGSTANNAAIAMSPTVLKFLRGNSNKNY